MSDNELSKEETILRAVKMTLTGVIKDTATKPGLKHPLTDNTVDDLRHCLALISVREQELAAENGRSMDKRPRFIDEPRPQKDVVIPLHTLGGLGKGKGKKTD